MHIDHTASHNNEKIYHKIQHKQGIDGIFLYSSMELFHCNLFLWGGKYCNSPEICLHALIYVKPNESNLFSDSEGSVYMNPKFHWFRCLHVEFSVRLSPHQSDCYRIIWVHVNVATNNTLK